MADVTPAMTGAIGGGWVGSLLLGILVDNFCCRLFGGTGRIYGV